MVPRGGIEPPTLRFSEGFLSIVFKALTDNILQNLRCITLVCKTKPDLGSPPSDPNQSSAWQPAFIPQAGQILPCAGPIIRLDGVPPGRADRDGADARALGEEADEGRRAGRVLGSFSPISTEGVRWPMQPFGGTHGGEEPRGGPLGQQHERGKPEDHARRWRCRHSRQSE